MSVSFEIFGKMDLLKAGRGENEMQGREKDERKYGMCEEGKVCKVGEQLQQGVVVIRTIMGAVWMVERER